MLSLRRRDIVCQQAVELVTDYLEGALSRRVRRRFEGHLKVCPNCAAYLEQIDGGHAKLPIGGQQRSPGTVI